MSARASKVVAVAAIALLIAIILLIAALLVGLNSAKAHAQTDPEQLKGQAAGRWQPKPGTSWQWQLSSQPRNLINVDVYDVDGFDTSKRKVNKIHRNGSKAICYINVGAWENWRPDKKRFPKSVLGRNYYGWAGEKWLDIRRINKLAPIMRARFDKCKQRGFDAIEPDNMDNYTNKTGFSIKAKHQLRYNKWLAKEAHIRGLSIALKNDPAQARTLQPYFDFAITEDCFDQGWCYKMKPFINSGKAVLAAEYTDTGIKRSEFCQKAKRMKFDAIYKKRNLGAWRRGC